MSRNSIETIMGAVVLVIAAGFLYTAYNGRQLQSVKNGYRINAVFDDVTGIATGSDVRVGGVKVGVVDGLSVDPKTYRAKLVLLVKHDIQMPSDSSATILGDGLMGSKFVALEAGADENMLPEGGLISITQSSVSLEQLIGKFVFSGGGVDKQKDAADNGTTDSNENNKNTTATEEPAISEPAAEPKTNSLTPSVE